MSEKIKIYQMNDCDWFAAESTDDAIKEFTGMYGYEYDSENGKYPRIVSDEAMDKLILTDRDGNEPDKTFASALAEMVADKANFPTFFASTEY